MGKEMRRGTYKTIIPTVAVERMVTPFIQWNVWLNHSVNGATVGETHVEGYF